MAFLLHTMSFPSTQYINNKAMTFRGEQYVPVAVAKMAAKMGRAEGVLIGEKATVGMKKKVGIPRKPRNRVNGPVQ